MAVVGNLTADPELRYTKDGKPVANFTIASTPRQFDRQSNEWKDQEALFLRASVWNEYAEHVAGSLTKGMQVVAVGYLKMRSYEDKEGNKRTSTELEISDIGPALRFATAQVTRAVKGQGGQQQAPQNNAQYGPPQGYGPPQAQPQQQPPQGYPAPVQQPPQGYPPQGAPAGPPQGYPPQQPQYQQPPQQGYVPPQQPAYGDETPF